MLKVQRAMLIGADPDKDKKEKKPYLTSLIKRDNISS